MIVQRLLKSVGLPFFGKRIQAGVCIDATGDKKSFGICKTIEFFKIKLKITQKIFGHLPKYN